MSTSTGLFGDSVTPFGVSSYRHLLGDISNRFTAKAKRIWSVDRGLLAMMVNCNKSVVRKNWVSDRALLATMVNANKCMVRKNVFSSVSLLSLIRDFTGSMHRNGLPVYTVINSKQYRLCWASQPLIDGVYFKLNTVILRSCIGQPIAGGGVEFVQFEGQLWPRFM